MNNLKNYPLLTTGEIAFVLKVSPRTVCLWAERSEIPALRVGRQWLFRRDEFNRWLERRSFVLNIADELNVSSAMAVSKPPEEMARKESRLTKIAQAGGR